MAAPGANLSYGESSFLWEMFFRKLGLKPRTIRVKNPTRLNNAADDGTTFPRLIGICVKYSATTAPQSNTAADAPSGIGDICIYVAANNSGIAHINPTSIDIYRCSAYVSTSSFTWTKIVD